METLTIKVKSKEKLRFIYEILRYFDFVELPKLKEMEKAEKEHDFFLQQDCGKTEILIRNY